MAIRYTHKLDISDASVIEIDHSLGYQLYSVASLGGNRTLSIINTQNNDSGILFVRQDGAGNRTLTYNGQNIAISSTADKVSVISFINIDGMLFLSVESTIYEGEAELSFDEDAQTYFDANGLANPDHKGAVSDMFVSLKAETAIWNKKVAGYIMWDTLEESKYNMFNPVDSDAAFRLTQTGAGTFSQGFTNVNTSAAGLYTKLQPSEVAADGLLTRVVSIKSDVQGTGVALGCASINNDPNDWFQPWNGSNQCVFRGGSATTNTKASTSSIGKWYLTSKSAGSETFKNGASLGSSAAFTPSANTVSDYIIGNGGSSGTATPTYNPFLGKISLVMFFDELSAAEVATLNTIIATLETALGR